MSKLYFRYGAMNSGKTTILLQVAFNYEERGQRVFIVKPSTDAKAENKLQSRIGIERQVDSLLAPHQDLLKVIEKIPEDNKPHCILIDEAQFLTPQQVEQAFTIAVVKGIPVIAYGIRNDFQTKGFPGSLRLLEMAHSLEELKTICRCGRKAIFNGRLINGIFVKNGGQVAIDGINADYESLCGKCYLEQVGLGQ